jgi:predicted Holliday junction resolvase-like endonuclease
MLLAQSVTAGDQIMVVVIPIVLGLVVLIGTIVKVWAEKKLASMKAEKALAEAALIEAEARAAIIKLEAEKKLAEAKAEAERQKKLAETLIKGVESISNPDIKKETKAAIIAFAGLVNQFPLVDGAVEALGLKKSKVDIVIPEEGN